MVKAKIDTAVKVNNYPKLMIAETGEIVLFLKDEVGVTVAEGANKIGTYREDWWMSAFKDFTGSITLSNEG